MSSQVEQRAARIAAMRRIYRSDGLDEANLAPSWIEQFSRWFDDSTGVGIVEPNAMVLATASADGWPSARTVLLKGYDARGFVLYTNYGSRKGRDVAENPRGSLVFPWLELQRQVVVVGTVERMSAEDSEAYFHTRPYGSRLGALASHQSDVLGSRAELEDAFAGLAERYPEGTHPPMPPGWGGLRVVPVSVEFWQGRADRLHDRLRYRRTQPDGGWLVERLAP